MKIIMFCLIVSAGFAQADDKRPSQKLKVHSFDENADLSSLDSKDYQVTKGLPESRKDRQELPSPDMLKKLFVDAGLGKDVQSMDDMDRDVLWRRADRLSVAAFLKEYPDLPSEGLKKFHKLVNQ